MYKNTIFEWYNGIQIKKLLFFNLVPLLPRSFPSQKNEREF